MNKEALSIVLSNVDDTISQSMRLDATNSLDSEWPSEATRNALKGLLENANRPLSTDNALSDMLAPPLVAYLEGSDTLETAAGRMESVLATYLSE